MKRSVLDAQEVEVCVYLSTRQVLKTHFSSLAIKTPYCLSFAHKQTTLVVAFQLPPLWFPTLLTRQFSATNLYGWVEGSWLNV